jgi:hypothetical protein
MAVIVATQKGRELWNAIVEGIDDGSIRTWAFDNSRKYLTHIGSGDQWKNRAFMKPSLSTDRLIFNIIMPRNENVTTEVYAIYHGRLIEMILAHFDKLFSSAQATAFPTTEDLIN